MGCREYRFSSALTYDCLNLLILLFVFLLSSSACGDATTWNFNTTPNTSVIQTGTSTKVSGDNRWAMSKEKALRNAETVLDTLTLQEKVGQLFFIAAKGEYMHQEEQQFIHLTEKIRTQHIGGILFFKGSIYGQAHLTNRLQEASSLPLWITQDMEFGAAMRVRGATTLTPAMGIAASGNRELARQAGYITAREARALGVHQIFAPVVDVNNNPQNPVINVRSFGGTPELVSRFSSAFIDGAEKAGIVSTAKHFPGHGDTHVDSHVRLPIIYSDYQALNNLELIPFRSAIRSGVESIMSAHISFPKISGQQRLPATMDPEILHQILRDSLQFDGLVVTDALEMKGITAHYTPGEAALKSIEAGTDILLISPDATAAMHHIRAAVKSGRLSEDRINQSALKLLTWKFRRGLFKKRGVNIDQLTQRMNPPQFQAKTEQIARRSITVLSNKMDIMPLHSDEYSSICAIALADDKSSNTGSRLGRALRKYHNNVRFHTYDRRSGVEEKARIRRCARQSDLLVIGSFVYVKTYQNITLNREQRIFIEGLSRYQNPEVLISFGNPYIFKDIPHAEVDMQAWAPFNIQVDAAVEALFGASAVNGEMPIRFPGHFERGEGLSFPQSAPNFAEGKAAPSISGDFIRDSHRKITTAINDSLFPGATIMVMDRGRMVYHNAFGYKKFDKQEPLQLSSSYALPDLTSQLAGVPYILADIQQSVSNSASDTSRQSLSKRSLPQAVIPLFNSGSPVETKNLWSSIQDYNNSRSPSDIMEEQNEQLWSPLEMRETRLKSTQNPNGKSSATPVLHSTTRDLNRLLYTLMNDGRYKNRQIFQDSLSNDFLSTSSNRKSTYKEFGNGASRVWINQEQQRAVIFLVNTNGDHRSGSERQALKNLKQELLNRIDRELSRPKDNWHFGNKSSLSS